MGRATAREHVQAFSLFTGEEEEIRRGSQCRAQEIGRRSGGVNAQPIAGRPHDRSSIRGRDAGRPRRCRPRRRRGASRAPRAQFRARAASRKGTAWRAAARARGRARRRRGRARTAGDVAGALRVAEPRMVRDARVVAPKPDDGPRGHLGSSRRAIAPRLKSKIRSRARRTKSRCATLPTGPSGSR